MDQNENNNKYELIENYMFLKSKYYQIYEVTKSKRVPVKDKAALILLLNNILASINNIYDLIKKN